MFYCQKISYKSLIFDLNRSKIGTNYTNLLFLPSKNKKEDYEN